MSTTAYQNIIDNSKHIFSLLAHNDSLKMFVISKDGLKISTSTLDTLSISPKKYYKTLKQLKDAGLIKKNREGAYVHTTFGSIVYQRNVAEMAVYIENLERMQMIDTLKQTEKFSEAAIMKLSQEIIDSAVNHYSFPSVISESTNNIDIIFSYDNIIQTLLERIECCKSEILIATRICPEIVINKILQKSKLGIKVKVVADTDLVKEYFRSQEKFADDLHKKDPIKERKCVIANPWYPDKTIYRRISDIPFGVIILDNAEVGVELLVNLTNPNNVYGGIWIKDEKFAIIMSRFYHEKIWDKAIADTEENIKNMAM